MSDQTIFIVSGLFVYLHIMACIR